MRLYLLILSLLAILLDVHGQPQALWLERAHDMGVFYEQNGKVACSMRVVNSGDEPLLIVKAQAGCGCTGVDYPETPIAAGDTGVVAITYNPAGRPGQFSKQVIIFTNTIPKRTTLEITGNVIPTAATLSKQYPVVAGPLRISQPSLPFGELTRGSNKTLFLSCYNASTDTLVAHVDGALPHLKPALVPDTVAPGRVTALTVHYLSGKAPQWGLNVDTLTVSCRPLQAAATALSGTAPVLVMAQVAEDFSRLTARQRQQAPVAVIDCGERLDCGAMRAGDIVSRTFCITNKGKLPLSIRRLWAPDGEGVTATADRYDVKAGKKAVVTVSIDLSRQSGDVLDVPLTLLCNDPDHPRQTVRLVGFIDK